MLPGDEEALYADVAYSSEETREKLKALNIADQVQGKGHRNNPLSEADKMRNAEIAVTRSGGERPFATYKQHYHSVSICTLMEPLCRAFIRCNISVLNLY